MTALVQRLRRVDPTCWVLLAALLVYANTLTAGFVYDDTTAIVPNPVLRGPLSLARVFTTDIWGLGRSDPWSVHTYRPLLTLSYVLDRAVGRWEPWSFHLTNVLLHAAASVLFFRSLARRLVDPAAALVAGLAFALHPLHTDAVASITNRSEVAYALAALGVYALHAKRGAGATIAAPLALAGGLLCKEAAVVVVPLLVVRDLLGTATTRAEKSARYAGYALALGATAAMRHLALGSIDTLRPDYLANPLRDAPVGVRAYWGVRFVGLVGRLLLAPLDLCADYGAGVVSPTVGLDGDVALGAAALVGLAVLAVRARRSDPLLTEACAWVLVPAALYSNVLKVLPAPFAERWWYLGSAGCFLLLGAGVRAARRRSRAALPAAGVALALWALVTVRRNADWATSQRLFESAVAVQPGGARMRYFVARFRFREERMAEAFAHVQVAVRNAPDWAEPYGLYGRLLGMQRRDAEAERAFARVGAMEGPTSRTARMYWVDYLIGRRRFGEARAQLEWLRAAGLWGADEATMEGILRTAEERAQESPRANVPR